MLAPTRCKLGKAVKRVNEMLGCLRLEKHPGKTFALGSSPRARIEWGFDLLGYHFRPGQLSVAGKTIEQFIERAIRLYEQEPGEAFASSRFGVCVRRWLGRARLDGSGDKNELSHEPNLVAP